MNTTTTIGAGQLSVVDLDRLRRRCLNNMELVERVLRRFDEQLDLDFNALEQALQQRDIEQFAQLAHRIKGMSANVEAQCLSHEAALAEQSALDARHDALAEHLNRMRHDRQLLAQSFATLGLKVR